jgi:hypothetical protein
MSPSVRFAISVLVGVIIGLGSARYMSSESSGIFANSYGKWQNWPVPGDTSSNPYTLARFLTETKLPEHFSEVLTFYRRDDDQGDGLSEDCNYLLSMPIPTARRWSVALETLPGQSPQLVTQDDVISVGGVVEVQLSNTPQPGNWLQISDAGSPKVILRLYDGETITAQGRNGQLGLPSITRLACP